VCKVSVNKSIPQVLAIKIADITAYHDLTSHHVISEDTFYVFKLMADDSDSCILQLSSRGNIH